MAGFDKLIFLFKDNEKIDVNKTSVSFVFGDTTPINPNVPCYPNPYIDPENNTFTIPCGCTTISYEDNTFKQNCPPPPPPDCTTDLYFDPDTTTFEYNCGCETKSDNNDFLIDCTATGGETGGTGNSIDFGIIINSYGIGSSTLFSLDIYNAESSNGFISDAIVNVADMRIPVDFAYGQKLDVTLFKYTYLDNNLTFGHSANTLISFDDQNYFTGDLNLAVGVDLNAKVIFNPYHEFNREVSFDYGLSANTLIVYDVRNPFEGEVNFSFDYDIKTFIVFDDNKFDREYIFSFGHEASTRLIYDDNKFTSDYNFYYNYSANATVTFDNGNNFEGGATTEYGYSADTFVLFAYPSPFKTDIISDVGFESDTLMTFGAPNPLPTIIVSEYGHSVNTTLIINLFENLVDFNKTIDVDYGLSANTFLIFNSYNPLWSADKTVDMWYGPESYATMRYSDDPYINDIENTLGLTSNFDLDVQIGLYTFAVDFPHGVDTSDTVLEYTIGLGGTAHYGIMSNILFVANWHRPVYLDGVSYFGQTLEFNQFNVANLDLLRKPCCVFHKNDLKHIEMTLEPDYDRQWMDWDMFNYKVEIMFTTQPRFSASIMTGMESDVVDSTSYLSADFMYGATANVRSMNFDSTIDLVGGNFIVDQNEIKVEMTKPEDEVTAQRAFRHGYESITLLTTERAYPMQGEYGFNITFNLWYDSPMRPNFMWGYLAQSSLGTNSRYAPTSSFGMQCVTIFYEPAYDGHMGFQSELEQLYTENFVEFLEEGEVKNEYIHQNKNGDPDRTKPNGVTIEGYVYTHYIKGRCY